MLFFLKMKKKRKKSKFLKLIEFVVAYIVILISRAAPLKVIKIISNALGDMMYLLVARRRKIAIENLKNAFKGEKDDKEIRKIARQSCRSFFLTFLEIIKLDSVVARSKTKELNELFLKAKRLHDESKGCIFVTPHLGSWEVLPYLSSSAGIPLTIVARPLDNEYLERLIYANRSASGQIIIPKKNALFILKKSLKEGRSVGMLPDQSTMKGIYVNFFGRKATTTPIPALLAITFKRPIVVIAWCRKSQVFQYEGFVSDPIWPQEYESKKSEIFRLTEEMNHYMEHIIRRYPEQYLWIHNRWKTYKGKREFLSNRKI
jgi:KDO2-lipid IV(A) lauroyltransferase